MSVHKMTIFRQPKQPYQIYIRILLKGSILNFRLATTQGIQLKAGVAACHISYVNELVKY